MHHFIDRLAENIKTSTATMHCPWKWPPKTRNKATYMKNQNIFDWPPYCTWADLILICLNCEGVLMHHTREAGGSPRARGCIIITLPAALVQLQIETDWTCISFLKGHFCLHQAHYYKIKLQVLFFVTSINTQIYMTIGKTSTNKFPENTGIIFSSLIIMPSFSSRGA